MKKAVKIIALLMAMLMLVTMATACKNSDDDDLNAILDSGTGDSGFEDDTNSSDDNNGSAGDNDSTNNDGGNTDNGEDTKNDGKDDKNNNSNSGSGNGPVSVNPDADDKKQEEITEKYDGTKKYEFASNPLLAESKKINTGVEPSFDIDTTGFVKNVKVKDLKGKSITMITSLEVSNFIYHGPKGELCTEWSWFECLKKTYSDNFKYVESRWDKAPSMILTYMNTGKQLDIIPTHRSGLAQLMNLSQPLDPYINMKYVNNSPGIDTRTMEQSKRHDGYRCIAPIGAVDVIWYNETMTKSLKLPDPYTLWKQDKWDWDAFRNYMVSVPKTAPNGNTGLRAFSQSGGDSIFFWPRTNGINVFEYKNAGNKTEIISNFEDPRCLEAWNFFHDTLVSYKGDRGESAEDSDAQRDMYTNGSVIMNCTLYLMRDYSYSDYAKSQQFRWVPYPKSPNKGGEYVAMNYGNTMMLPKKMKNQSNIPYAIKVMEIWANRFTEAINDYLQEPYYNFTYDERVEFFNFVSKHNYFNPAGGWRNVLSGDDRSYYTQFERSMYREDYNVATTAKQVSNIINKAVQLMTEYGD